MQAAPAAAARRPCCADRFCAICTKGKIRRMIFAGTGAMMSPTSVQQSQPIAGICHAVVLERSGA
ncbi:MAG: hypothetical protein ACLR4Z_13410 [Butyricicoccaceae bacterium]